MIPAAAAPQAVIPEPGPPLRSLEEKLSWRMLIFLWVLLFQTLVLAYLPAFQSPFIYDDLPNIVYNEDFRSDVPLKDILQSHPTSMQFDKRPVGGLLSWLNFQAAGLNVGAFRGVNLLIHWLAAGAAGLVTALVARRAGGAFPRLFGVVVAVIWALHPIHSTAVIYISQRMETLMSLFFLLSCACLLLGGENPARVCGWRFLCGVSALLCLLSKENGAGLPLILLVMDRLLEGGWGQVWKKHRVFHTVLSLLWVAALVWIAGGARLEEVDRIPALSTPWAYFKTECHVVLHYFQLLLWPSPLVFAPVPRVAQTLNDWLPALMALAAGFAAVALLARRRPWIWIPWLTVLIVLAPTSSFVPVPLEPAFDYRMHLPALGALALALAAFAGVAAAAGRRTLILTGGALGVLAVIMIVSTRQRAGDYGRPESIWLDTVTKEPENVKAWVNLAAGLYQHGHIAQAREALRMLESVNQAFQLPWVTAEGAGISALMAESEQKWPEAEMEWKKAAAALPDRADFRVGQARAAFRQHRAAEALAILDAASAGSGNRPDLMLWRAHALYVLGRKEEARQAALPAERLRAPDSRLMMDLNSWRRLRDNSTETGDASKPTSAGSG